MNKTIELPARTAGECTLADGTRVWVQTLNTLQRDQVGAASRKHALKTCRPLMTGGDERAALRADYRDLSAEEQAIYLAGHEVWMGRFLEAAEKAFPDPQEPDNDGDTEKQITGLAEWEAACEVATAKRKEHEETLFEGKQKEALALTTRKRVDACLSAAIEREFAKAFLAQHTLEALRRAVRQSEDHSVFYFRNVQDVEDAPDADRDALLAKYVEMDSLTQRQIPT